MPKHESLRECRRNYSSCLLFCGRTLNEYAWCVGNQPVVAPACFEVWSMILLVRSPHKLTIRGDSLGPNQRKTLSSWPYHELIFMTISDKRPRADFISPICEAMAHLRQPAHKWRVQGLPREQPRFGRNLRERYRTSTFNLGVWSIAETDLVHVHVTRRGTSPIRGEQCLLQDIFKDTLSGSNKIYADGGRFTRQ